MSLTPVAPERCGHVAPMVSEPTEGGYRARYLRCGTTGPVQASSGEARRALLEPPEVVSASSLTTRISVAG
jgi:hypothetical protein